MSGFMDHFELIALAGFGLAAFVLKSTWKNKKEKKGIKALKKTQASGMTEPNTLHPEINPALCAGCGGCTKVCPEGDILQLVNNKAVLVSPTKCVGHGECEAACPMGAIDLVFGTKTRGMDIPRVSGNYETNVPGIYIAGELGGMGLIRNAVKQGSLAAEHALASAKAPREGVYDILIVGAGPAGIAAGLKAIEKKRSYLIIDQNTFGGTVANFPRQKIVMSKPAELPVVGKMQFQSDKVSKEQLLAYWGNIRQRTGLKVTESCKFEGVADLGNGVFQIKTSKGEFKAAKIILAMGVRGSPRKLGLKNEDMSKVTYSLIDASQYVSKEIAVVGSGNSALEAVISLCNSKLNNKINLLIRGPGFDRSNQENQDAVKDLEAAGRVKIHYNTVCSAIEEKTIEIASGDKKQSIANDYLFIFAGAEIPFKFLMDLGIQIDKKFGEGRNKKPAPNNPRVA